MAKIGDRYPVDFDKVMEIVGTNGRYQKMTIAVTALAFIPNALAAIAPVFEAASPRFWCYVPELENFTKQQQQEWLSLSSGESGDLGTCNIPALNYSRFLNQDNLSFTADSVKTVPCERFQYDTSEYQSTIVTRWDLVCSNVWLKALSTSLFMLGQLLGVLIFGHLSDTIGRKKAWLISILMTVITGSAAAFVSNYWTYSLLRLLSAASSLGGCVCSFTLGMETVGINERNHAYLVPHYGYAIGVELVAFLGYFIRDYAWLQLTISLVPLPMMAIHWVLGESPRWLLKTRRYDEAERELQKMARMNKRTIPDKFLETLDSSLLNVKEEHTCEKKHNLLDLMQTPNMRFKTLIIWFTWFVTSSIYFGLYLGTGNLAGNVYVNLCIAGAMDFVAITALYLLLNWVGRVPLISISLLFGGISCALMVAASDVQWLVVSFSMAGRLGVSLTFCVVYLQATEFYPTLVRGIGLGAASMSARVGSILAPFIADMGSLVWGPLPQILFASFSVSAGFLCLLLPETLRQELPETLEDGEQFARGKRGCLCCQRAQVVESDSEDHKENTTESHTNLNFEKKMLNNGLDTTSI